jgi:hypothetical protein
MKIKMSKSWNLKIVIFAIYVTYFVGFQLLKEMSPNVEQTAKRDGDM